ncbi:MAG TPA: PAS domain S-box protein [Gaiellales bacterium]|nr:PAS domain S-box protein [Gaiellales bacterium]
MLDAFLELTQDAAFTKSLDGTILSWNAGAEQLYGYASAEVIGRPVTLLFPKGRRDEVDHILRELALGRPVLNHETVRVRRDGRLVYISLRAAPIFDQSGSVSHASVIARDIGQRMTARQLPIETERCLRAFLSLSPRYAVLRDGWGRILHCNQPLADLVGQRPADLVLRCWAETFGDSPEHRAFLESVSRDAVAPTHSERLLLPGGNLSIHWQNVPLHVGGRIVAVASIAAEPSGMPIGGGEAAVAAAILAAESAERGRLADALHDDTVQVLTAALYAVDRARRDSPLPQLMDASAAISEAIDRTRHMMLDLSPTLLGHHGLGAAVQSLCHQSAKRAGLEVSVSVTDQRFPDFVEQLAYRTTREAVINAERHSKATELAVRVEQRDELLLGEVQDNGVGFDPTAVVQRFDAHLHLGLTRTAERLQAVRGDLDIDSRPGAGTRVRFRLPVPSFDAA